MRSVRRTLFSLEGLALPVVLPGILLSVLPVVLLGVLLGAGIVGCSDASSGENSSGSPVNVAVGGTGESASAPLASPSSPSSRPPAASGVGSGQSALADRFYSGFNPLVDPNEIFSGGPPPDGIPPIDSPSFLPPAEVDFLSENEPVIALELNGDSRAYPVQIMTWHEIVNDTVGGIPVTVTYCPLCNSSVAYNRVWEGLELDFGTSGSLYNSSLVMYDRQTETLWTHFDGRAVIGELEGAQLDFFPIAIVPWGQWRDVNPDGQVLDRVANSAGQLIRQYGENPYSGYLDNPNNGFLSGAVDDRLLIKELVVGVRSDSEAVAVIREDLAELGVVDVALSSVGAGSTEITIWHLSGTNSALDTRDIQSGRDIGSIGVFERQLGTRTLDFVRIEGGFRDSQTGSVWNIFGEAISGELQGSQLTAREYLDTFWFAWSGFHPETQVFLFDA